VLHAVKLLAARRMQFSSQRENKQTRQQSFICLMASDNLGATR